MNFNDEIIDLIKESISMKEKMFDLAPIINEIAELIIDAYNNHKKILIFGNGGSAADAQHIAAEFSGKFFLDRKPLPALALHTNTSSLTAIGNDFGFEDVFRRQVEAFLIPGDVVIGISTSGNSPNVVEAIKFAKKNGGRTVAFVGGKNCVLDEISEFSLKIPSTITPRIQEGHITAGHIICYLVEKSLFGNV